MKYNFKKETETAILPTRHTPVSAGVDFYADEEIKIRPMQSGIVSTGISWNPKWFPIEVMESSSGWEISFNIALIIQSRSGYAFKKKTLKLLMPE